MSEVLEQVKTTIIGRAKANGFDLTGWFDSNANRLRVFSAGLAQILGRLPLNGKSDADRAHVAYTEVRSAIERSAPSELPWFDRNRNVLVAVASAISSHSRAPVLPPAAVDTESWELRSEAERLSANIAAIKVLGPWLNDPKSSKIFDDSERRIMRRYTGFGGVSIRRAAAELPTEWLPEKRGLIHEYYTPEKVANSIAESLLPFRVELAQQDGTIKALEPSAGIGRLIHAFDPQAWPNIKWTAIEYSRISSKLLAAIRPDVNVIGSSFEEFVVDNKHLFGTYDLVVSNPPYGIRGRQIVVDREQGYKETRAYAYQMRRGLDFLRPNGIGIFLIPSGFMTGTSPALRGLRERVLQRAHLMTAFRLPSETEDGKSLFPGALLVTDLVFLRSRGGEVKRVPEADRYILEGQFFKASPSNVLGREVGAEGDDDEQTRAPRFGYQVRGTFTSLPPIAERDNCRDCVVTPQKRYAAKKKVELPENVEHALALARRTAAYLSWIARGDGESSARASVAHAELHRDLTAWFAQPDEARREDLKFVKAEPELATLANVFTGGKLMSELEEPPKWVERYPGNVEDVPAHAHWLWRRGRSLTLEGLLREHKSSGGSKDAAGLMTALHNAGWCEDPGSASPLQPPDQYYSGSLWPKYDRAAERARHGDPTASTQANKLLQLIAPATFAEISVEPRLGWIPISVLEAWVNDWTGARGAYRLEREGGFLKPVGTKYLDLAEGSESLRLVLGYLNHDMAYFRPSVSKDEDLEKKRLAYAEKLKEGFVNWIEEHPEHQADIVETHNRLFRGWITPTYSQEPIQIARWNTEFPLWPYQYAAVRRMVANRGGGCFFDVGLGKTRTLLGAVALAKQDGLAKRVVIAAPNSLVFNWAREIEKVLPDYRYVIIGARPKVVSRGARKGQLVSEPDTPLMRAAKWQRFQAGLYDIAIVTYSALPRTQIELSEVLAIVQSVPAVQRELTLKVRETARRIESLERKEKKQKIDDAERRELNELRKLYQSQVGTERKEAILAEKEEAFAAKWAVPPANQEPDPGIFWTQLGIDFLGYDESHIGKNLWTAGAREGGEPRFLGSPQEGSYIAWQLYLRAYLVRKATGGSGVYLADATPAKNSPLEFLSILSDIDSDIWNKLGIDNPEQFITQYLNIQLRLIQDTDLTPADVPCVVGFKNLDQLREVLFRYGEFQTAKSVGLKVPEPKVHRIEVEMDDEQEAKYEEYLKAYQSAIDNLRLNPDGRYAALGLLQRMALVAVHSLLDEGPPDIQTSLPLESKPEVKPQADDPMRTALALAGMEAGALEPESKKDRPRWTFGNARLARRYDSPKLLKIVEIITRRKDCGHIVFLENVAAHFWLKELLVKAGIDESRIAVLNGETAPDPATRQRIAEGFTNEPALYDIVIANKIAYEGVNLQTRTCSIFHGDLPYEPATLQQRNGRGLRQGNRFDVIDIYYILSKRSSDMARFQLIAGKREWMSAILESAASETNNPAAQADMSPEDWLIYLSRDTEQTRALIEKKKREAAEAENERIVKLAWASVRQIAIRQRDIETAKDEFLKNRLQADIERLSNDLAQHDPLIWPWRFIASEIAKNTTLAFGPTNPGAVWDSARYLRMGAGGKPYAGGEFGKVRHHPGSIGYRRLGSLQWETLNAEEAYDVWSATSPADWGGTWPSYEEELEAPVAQFIRTIGGNGVSSLRAIGLGLASERFKTDLWQKAGEQISKALLRAYDAHLARIPAKWPEPVIATLDALIKNEAVIYPWTTEGYHNFLADCKASRNLKWSEIDAICDWWWGKRAPRNLLATSEQEEPNGQNDTNS